MPLTHTQLITLLGLPFAAAIIIAALARFTVPRRLPIVPARCGDDTGAPGRRLTWPARLALPLALLLGPALALFVAPLVMKDVVVPLHLRPTEARDWYLFVPAVALLLGVAAVWMPRRFTALAFAALGALLALRLSINRDMTVPVELWAALAAPAFLYAVLEPLARRNHNPALPIILLLLAGSAVCVETAGISQLHGFTCLPLPAALLGMLVAYGLFPDRDLSRAALPAFLLLFLAILFDGYFSAGVTWQRTILLLVAPLAAYVADIPPMSRLRPFWRASLRVALVAIPLAFAVVPAARDLRANMNAGPQMEDM